MLSLRFFVFYKIPDDVSLVAKHVEFDT